MLRAYPLFALAFAVLGCRTAIAPDPCVTAHVPEQGVQPAPGSTESVPAPVPAGVVGQAPTELSSSPASSVPTSPDIRAARDHAQRRVLRPIEPLLPDLSPPGAAPPGALPGTAVSLEYPAEVDPLAHFHAALDRLASHEAGAASGGPPATLRIAAYGASGTAEDMWTGYLRAYLQARFGDAGPGVVSAAPHTRWYHHNELRVTATKGWAQANPQRKPLLGANTYGLMLVLMRGIPRHNRIVTSTIAPASARTNDLRIAHYEVWSRLHPRGGTFSIAIDGEQKDTVRTASSTPSARYDAFDVAPGPHTLSLTLQGDAEVDLFGVVAESDKPGVVVDTLGFDGARSMAHVANDEASWAEQMRRRDYDLYLLAYGTNEGFQDRKEPLDEPAFAAEFSELLARFARAAPEASCVVLVPALHDAVPEGAISPAPRLAVIRSTMHRLALRRGCAIFDGGTLLGPPDGMRAWIDAGLGRKDFVHLTARGNVLYGMAVGDALMERWDQGRAGP
jgi:hypothetical protein